MRVAAPTTSTAIPVIEMEDRDVEPLGCPKCGAEINVIIPTARGDEITVRVTHELPVCDWIGSEDSNDWLRALVASTLSAEQPN